MQENVKLYKANYEHLPKRFVDKIERDLQYIIRANVPGLRKIYLFGSCARGEVRSSSDVDLLLVTADKISDRVLAADIRWTLDEPVNGVRTDIVYQNETSEKTDHVFDRVVNRDRKLILEVTE